MAVVDDLTTTHLNTTGDDPAQARVEIYDAILKLKELIADVNQWHALVTRTTTQSLSGSSAVNVISWDSEAHDASDIHSNSTNPSRITAPSSASLVRAHAAIYLDTAVTNLRGAIRLNGAHVLGNGDFFFPSSTNVIHVSTPMISFTAGTGAYIDCITSYSDAASRTLQAVSYLGATFA